MTGTLYVIATPIGNLGDITFRAIETLKQVSKIYAEDTRVANKLLKNFDIDTPTKSFHAHSKQNKYDLILKDLIEGKDIALVADAGTPGISDPGNELINYIYMRTSQSLSSSAKAGDPENKSLDSRLRGNDIVIRSIPGPSSVTAALSMCGFNVNKFLFLGFLPKKGLIKVIEEINNSSVAVAYFDSPHRVLKNLQKLLEVLEASRRVFVAREVTKLHETHYRGNIADVLEQLKQEKMLKGELVVVVESSNRHR